MKKGWKINIENLKDFADDINVKVEDIKYKTPTIITYENRKFNINTKNYYEIPAQFWTLYKLK